MPLKIPNMLPPFKVEKRIITLTEAKNYGHHLHNIPEAWKRSKGEGVSVAVLDTGLPTHDDLKNQIFEYANFTQDPVEDNVSGHSVHVSGIICAEENFRGVVGVAPRSKLFIAKVLGDDGSGIDSQIAAGIRWAVDKKVDIINMSLGAPAEFEEFLSETKKAVQEAYAAGIHIICAAGNEDADKVGVPARWPECIAVAAVDNNQQRAWFSNKGDTLDFAASGVDILSTYINNGFANLSGTCLTGDTKILTGEGPVSIKDIGVGDMVFSLNEKKNKIESKRCTNVIDNGIKQTYEVKTKNNTICATENHPFLVLEVSCDPYFKIKDKKYFNSIVPKSRTKEKCAFLKKYGIDKRGNKLNKVNSFFSGKSGLKESEINKMLNILNVKKIDFNGKLQETKRRSRETKLVWKQLKDIKIGDFIISMKNIDCSDNDYDFSNFIEMNKNYKRYKNEVFLPEKSTDDFCRIIGAFVGDGNFIKDHRRKSINQGIAINIDIGKKKGDFSEKYKEIIEKTFNVEVVNDNGVLRTYSVRLAKFFHDLGLDFKADKKRIPRWVWELPKSQKNAFIGGLLDSDGWITNSGHLGIELCNKELIGDIKYLLQSLGFLVSNIKSRTRENPWKKIEGRERYNQKEFADGYTIVVSNPKKIKENIKTFDEEYNVKLSKKINGSYFDDKYHYFNNKNWKDITVSRVLSLKPNGFQKVYDITIDGNHNFIANGIVVHNSMASPFIAGIAALVISEHKNRTGPIGTPIENQEDLVDHIKKISVDLGEEGHDNRYGDGFPVFKREPEIIVGPPPEPEPTPKIPDPKPEPPKPKPVPKPQKPKKKKKKRFWKRVKDFFRGIF